MEPPGERTLVLKNTETEPFGDALAKLSIIRTETALSKLPIHNLAKTGRVNIQIVRRNAEGQLDLKWEVSYSDRYGQPRQLAYKVDTLIVNRRIDESGRPTKRLLRLGTLSQICKELGVPASGKNTNDLRKAIHQNAGAYIMARLNYKGVDGTERMLEAGFTRYSVVFTGERLPDGRAADAVYLILNDPYLDVLNNAPRRPLNYEYLRELRPAAQRFYEVISYRIFAALKYRRDQARIAYSDYCTYSAQQRYYDQEHFRVQMYKIHKPHLESGYLKSVQFAAAVDREGKPDWILTYTPGPKARAEHEAFNQRPALAASPLPDLSDSDVTEYSAGAADVLLAACVERGIHAAQARKLLASLAPDQPVLEQLEWADSLLRQSAGRIRNPAGFYVSIVRDNLPPPPDFVSSQQRQMAVHAEREQSAQRADLLRLELAYEEYRQNEVGAFIEAHWTAEELNQAIENRVAEIADAFPTLPEETLREMAHGLVRKEVAERIELRSFESFRKPTA